MRRELIYRIPPEKAHQSAAAFLREKGFSRHLLNELKTAAGAIEKNGRPCRLYEELAAGDQLRVSWAESPGPRAALPLPLPLPIVYEDEDILVVDKVPGMPVHTCAGHYEDTLANAVNWYCARREDPIIFRCINRLDKDTSGLLIVAKHMLSGCVLSAAMKARQISRTYLAVVRGRLDLPGTIDEPIARQSGSILLRCVDRERGERAVTHYEPVAWSGSPALTLVRLRLETGRTHQIRVHMAHIGHPLAGDGLYGAGADAGPGTDVLIRRQALHSSQLIFRHPVTGQTMTFHSPMPKDMERLMDAGYPALPPLPPAGADTSSAVCPSFPETGNGCPRPV